MKVKRKILYIEDYPIIQEMYLTILKGHGYIVDVVGDGKEAMDKTSTTSYDLILLDLLLPKTTGIEFLREYVKENDPEKVIILTDFEKPEIVAEVKSLGVKHYWIKVENTPHLLAQRIEHFFKDNN